MNMVAHFIHRHVLLPAFETGLKRRKTLRYWRDLDQSQWWSRPALDALQLGALQRVIRHAYEHCEYYRQAWDRLGLQKDQVCSLSDFAKWPIITRETIRENRLSMRATRNARPLISKSTGGSSGVPLHFDLDQNSNDRRCAACHRGYGWASAAPGTKQLHLWGTQVTGQTLKARIKDRLYHRLHRRCVVSCFERDDSLARRFAASIDRQHPDAIVAYTNPLYEVAREIDRTGGAPSHRPSAIVVGAEKLHSFQRELIERVFKAPVFETYGSREFMLIGAECERHEGLHLTSEHLLVEILDDNGQPSPDGAEGNVVITDLYNYGMPFIRYANGDRAIAGLGQCSCGRGLPLLRKVVGRRLDVLYATGGRTVPGEFFPHMVKDFPAVRRFQVIQESLGHVRFTLSAEGMTEEDGRYLEQLVRSALGPEVRVDFEPVRDIALTAAGKLQVVINRVAQREAA